MPAQQAQWNLGALMSARPQPVAPVTSGGEIFGGALSALAQILQQQMQTKATTGIAQQQLGLQEQQLGLQRGQLGLGWGELGLGQEQLGQRESEFARKQAWEREQALTAQTQLDKAAKQPQIFAEQDYLFEYDPVTRIAKEIYTTPIPTMTAGVNEVAYNPTLDKYIAGPVVAGQDEVILNFLTGELLYSDIKVIEDENSLQKVIFRLMKVGDEYKWIQTAKPIDLPPMPEGPGAVHFDVIQIAPGVEAAVLWNDKPDPATGEIKYERVVIELTDWQKEAVERQDRALNLIEKGIESDERTKIVIAQIGFDEFMAGLEVTREGFVVNERIEEIARQAGIDVATINKAATQIIADVQREVGMANVTNDYMLGYLQAGIKTEEAEREDEWKITQLKRDLRNDARNTVQGQKGFFAGLIDFPTMMVEIAAVHKGLLKANFPNMTDEEIEREIALHELSDFLESAEFKGGKITNVEKLWKTLEAQHPTMFESTDINRTGREYFNSLSESERRQLAQDPEKRIFKEALKAAGFSKEEIDKYVNDLKMGRIK